MMRCVIARAISNVPVIPRYLVRGLPHDACMSKADGVTFKDETEDELRAKILAEIGRLRAGSPPAHNEYMSGHLAIRQGGPDCLTREQLDELEAEAKTALRNLLEQRVADFKLND